ncbi:conserved hypothetical protein [Luteimonas sp. 9C]|uniref:hypothetical protein n=1 Tax=Luteimonas sp. 9C TaxID=2653148 RepID=UPI0012F0B802|nr:hypothetical protein [Luteimonas sp. 9C]VXC13777.1 conserved hypothetical protein [Luteimonas sp. 9C]
MGLLRIATVGALGYFAYQAWQRRTSAPQLEDDASPGTDRPLVTNVSDDANRASHDNAATTPGAGAH